MTFQEFKIKVKYFLSSTWGKILVSVVIILALILIIFLPIIFSFSGSYKALYCYSFEESVSGTAEIVNRYMGIDSDYQNWNKGVNFVVNEDQMINGVNKTQNSIGYLGESVSNYEYNNFVPLNLYSDETGNFENFESDDYPIFSTLNIWFRVPSYLSEVLYQNLMYSETNDYYNGSTYDIDSTIWGTSWTLQTLSQDQQSFLNDVKNNNYLDEFIFSFIFFNWVAYSEAAKLVIEDVAKYYEPDDEDRTVYTDLEFLTYSKNLLDNLLLINSSYTLQNYLNNNVIYNDSLNEYQLNIILTIEGTGTDLPTIDALSHQFSDELNTFINDYYPSDNDYVIDFSTTLNNYGSGQAFAPPGQNGASSYSFLGTQSRSFTLDEAQAYWDYDVDDSDLNSDGIYLISDISQNMPLYFTFGLDPILVFVDDDTSFSDNGISYIPTGITPIGLKSIYSFSGQTWDWLYTMGFITVEEKT